LVDHARQLIKDLRTSECGRARGMNS
jgi:hypothetical protein